MTIGWCPRSTGECVGGGATRIAAYSLSGRWLSKQPPFSRLLRGQEEASGATAALPTWRPATSGDWTLPQKPRQAEGISGWIVPAALGGSQREALPNSAGMGRGMMVVLVRAMNPSPMMGLASRHRPVHSGIHGFVGLPCARWLFASPLAATTSQCC